MSRCVPTRTTRAVDVGQLLSGRLPLLFALRVVFRSGVPRRHPFRFPLRADYFRALARMNSELNKQARGTKDGTAARWWWSQSFPTPEKTSVSTALVETEVFALAPLGQRRQMIPAQKRVNLRNGSSQLR